MELDQFRDVDLVIDYANYTFIEKQFVSQGDYKGRTLTVLVTNKGVVGEVPGLMLNLNWHNEASGLTDLSAFSVLDKTNSIYRIEYPQNMMTPGRVIASIQVIQDGKVTNLKQFQLTVQKLAGQPAGIVDKAEFSALVAVLAGANKFRTDIDILETKKADATWVKSTFATAQTQFMSTFYTLQDLKNAYPTGTKGTYLVIENNSLYAYENGNWTNKGRYEAGVDVKDGAVNWRKTNFLNVGKNKLNPDTIQTGGYFNPDSGAWMTGADYSATEEIPVVAGETWTVNLCRFVAFYNAQGQVVTPGVADPSIGRNTFTIPANAVNMRVSFLTQRLDAVQIERGSEPTAYEPFGYLFEKAMLSRKNIRDFKILSDQDVEADALSVQSVNFVQTAKNKFNPATVVDGYYNHPDSGIPFANGSYQYNLISIPEDAEKVAINKCRFLTFFIGDKYLSGITNSDDIKTVADIPIGATKLATSNRIREMETVQVEFNGDTTSFEPFMEILEGVKVRGTDILGEAGGFEVVLPKTIYGTIGEEIQIYTKNFLPTIEKKFEVDYNAKYSLQNEDGLLINPTETAINAITLELFSNYLSVFRDDITLSVKPMRSTKLVGLVFGDSTINATYETQRIIDKLVDNIELVGTRGSGANKHEGRGGWTFATYRTATEYQGTVNPFFDPTKGDFSFEYYAAQQQLQKLDFLFIQLGINDTFNYFSDAELKSAIEKILADANYIINDILAFDNSIKIGLAITFPPNDSQNVFGTAYGTSQNQWRYKRNNHLWQKTLIDTFANDNRVTLVPLSAVIDTAKNIADGVHPTVSGYNQLGDQVVAWLNHI